MSLTLTEQSSTLVVTSAPANTLTVSSPAPAPRLLLAPGGLPGPQGPPGTPGASTVGGYGVSLSSPVDGDLLGFDGTAWTNRAQATVTDGGNF